MRVCVCVNSTFAGIYMHAFEFIKEPHSALAEDHRVLIQLLSMFGNGVGSSVCMSCGCSA